MSSLTSLKKEPRSSQEPSSDKLTLQEEERIRLGEVRGEVAISTRKRDELQEEIERLGKATQLTKERQKSDTEVKDLKVQKNSLLKQIKELGRVVFAIKEEKKYMEKGIDETASERIKTLELIGKKISSTLEKRASVLRVKSGNLAEQGIFLTDLSDYLGKHAKIVEAEAVLNAQRGVKLDKRYRDSLELKKTTLKLNSKAKERHIRASEKFRSADSRYEKADKITIWFEGEADKEKHRLEVWAKALEIREKKVASTKGTFKKIGEKQEDKGLWLLDQEETLRRTMLEVRKRESVIMKRG